MITRSWGYIELNIFIGEGRDVQIVSSRFLAVIFKNVYNCILGRPIAVSLDDLASLAHFKLKFHSLHGELVTVNVDLEGVNRIYQEI